MDITFVNASCFAQARCLWGKGTSGHYRQVYIEEFKKCDVMESFTRKEYYNGTPLKGHP